MKCRTEREEGGKREKERRSSRGEGERKRGGGK